MRRFREQAYPNTDVFVICFALDDELSLRNVTEYWLNEVRTIGPAGTPMILIGLKSDIRKIDATRG